MTRKRFALAAGLVLAATFVLLVWVVPTVVGPRVDCIDIDPTPCDQAWRDLAAHQEGIGQLLPVTYAKVQGPCLKVIQIERAYTWLFGVIETPLC